MTAAVVETEDRNANWSSKFRPGDSAEGWRSAWQMYLRTTHFSRDRDKTGVTEIGLKSFG